MIRYLLLMATSLVMFASCSTQRTVTNVRAADTLPSVAVPQNEKSYLYRHPDSSALIAINMPDAVIQKNDILHIRVFSQSILPETDLPYNLVDASLGTGTGGSVSPSAGFLVNTNGNIEYPQIGTIHAEGLTKEQLADDIKKRLLAMQALKNPSVVVRFLNYKITVLGEVKNPMQFTASSDHVSILDALGTVGDVNEYGDKSNIKIARQQNGKVEIGKIDLTTADFFRSPYYWLKQNDVVIVSESERKMREELRDIRKDAHEIRQFAKEQQVEERQSVAQQIGIITGIITSLALILNLIK